MQAIATKTLGLRGDFAVAGIRPASQVRHEQVRASSVNGTGLPTGGKAHLDEIQRAIGVKIGMAARTASTKTVFKTSRAIGKFVGAAGAAAAAGKLKYKALKATK